MLVPPSYGPPLPPTHFALKVRPLFIALLAIQSVLMLGRFLILDLWGAILTLMVVLVGGIVVGTGAGMDTTYCLYYGLMCLVNGVFDIILCVERCLHVKYAIFSRDAPWIFNFASIIFILCPLVEISCTILSAYIYMDAQEAESRFLMPPLLANQFGAGREDGEVPASRYVRGAGAGVRSEPTYRPFEGRCHRL
mmetsp:Transcript_41189/g.88517  ORF Transcript_41189/g.88517 Transcript_41189/m.88517 type:complete len:194 (+) Transcript_41189:182-763(+)